MIVLLIVVLVVAAYLLGGYVARRLILADLEAARRRSRVTDQAAMAEIIRQLRGRP